MFDKRLLREMPETKSIILKQVLYQWLGLLMNIILTGGLCYLFIALLSQTLTMKELLFIFVLGIVILILRAICLKKVTILSFQGASLVKRVLRQRIFQKVLNLGNHYLDDVSTGELVQLSVEGINQLETYFALYLPQLFYSVFAPLTLFVVVLFLDWISALVLLICVPLIPLSIVFVQKFAKKLLAKYWGSYTTLGDSFLENIQGLTTLKIYQSDEYKQKQMNKEAENFRKVTMRVLIMQLNSISVMDIVAYGGAGLGSYLALIHFFNQSLSLFGALFILLMSFEFFIPLRQLGSFFHIAMNGIAASEKIFKILDIQEQKQGQERLHEDEIDIQVSDLYFQYDERLILKNISFSIKPLQFIGIVGESGSGKSTIAKLIMGMHSGYEGEILLQGHQRYHFNDDDFLKQIVYITHEPMIFKGTLKDNLDPFHQYQEKELWQVLKKVCLDQFFKQGDGLETRILEAGSNLSGGQKQRLNLARALLKDARIYIFDEATSHIDVESEDNILQIIHELSKYKTIIMITHRLSTVQKCDQILVMKNGELVEQGTHHDLKRVQGDYTTLLKQQAELEGYQR